MLYAISILREDILFLRTRVSFIFSNRHNKEFDSMYNGRSSYDLIFLYINSIKELQKSIKILEYAI